MSRRTALATLAHHHLTVPKPRKTWSAISATASTQELRIRSATRQTPYVNEYAPLVLLENSLRLIVVLFLANLLVGCVHLSTLVSDTDGEKVYLLVHKTPLPRGRVLKCSGRTAFSEAECVEQLNFRDTDGSRIHDIWPAPNGKSLYAIVHRAPFPRGRVYSCVGSKCSEDITHSDIWLAVAATRGTASPASPASEAPETDIAVLTTRRIYEAMGRIPDGPAVGWRQDVELVRSYLAEGVFPSMLISRIKEASEEASTAASLEEILASAFAREHSVPEAPE